MVTLLSLKIVFAGTPAFAAAALEALLGSSHQVIAVYTQPDRPAGRGLKLTSSPVKELALARQIPVYQPVSLKEPAQQAALASLQPDVMVVAAYGMLLPEAVLRIPRFGCVNIHPSLLPRWRGAAPIQRTIFAGDAVSGVTIMQMEAGLDTGPILLQHAYTLADDETAETLHDKLAVMGAQSLVEALDLLAQGKLHPQPQDNSQATYAHKITKEEARLDWRLPANQLEYRVRAFNPWPVAFTTWNSETLRIWNAKALRNTSSHSLPVPGALIQASHEGIDVAAGEGTLRLLSVQLPGGKILSAADFYNARHQELLPGQRFV